MESSEKLLVEITAIFKTVKYRQITFHVSPEKKTLDYSVETTGKLVIDDLQKKSELVLDRKKTGLKSKYTLTEIQRRIILRD